MDCAKIYSEAMQAGYDAAFNHTPTPMIVQQHSNMMDDNSPVVKSWNVPGGVCGFAEIIIKPGNCGFARYLKSRNIGHKYYYGGWSWWVSEFGQSMERKEKYAGAVCQILKKYGINCYSTSRMD